jgi:hypothetical protein
MAEVYHKNKDFDSAKRELDEAWRIAKLCLGKDNPETDSVHTALKQVEAEIESNLRKALLE